MSTSYPNVGDLVMVAEWHGSKDASWLGQPMEVLAVDAPFVCVKERFCGAISLDTRRCRLMRPSAEYVAAMQPIRVGRARRRRREAAVSQLDDDEMDWVGSDELTEQPSPERVAPAPEVQDVQESIALAEGQRLLRSIGVDIAADDLRERLVKAAAQEPAVAPPSGAGEPIDAIEYDSAGYPHKVRHKTVADPRAAAMFQEIRDQLAANPEPDSKEWWRQVSQGLSAEIATLRAALASAQQERDRWKAGLADEIIAIKAERDSAQAQIAALTAENEKLWSVRARGCSCVCHDDYEAAQPPSTPAADTPTQQE